MRIIIEMSESDRNMVLQTEGDGTVTRQTGEDRPGEAMDAGAPDASLMEQISGAGEFISPSGEDQPSATDAGAAPTDRIAVDEGNGDVSPGFEPSTIVAETPEDIMS